MKKAYVVTAIRREVPKIVYYGFDDRNAGRYRNPAPIVEVVGVYSTKKKAEQAVAARGGNYDREAVAINMVSVNKMPSRHKIARGVNRRGRWPRWKPQGLKYGLPVLENVELDDSGLPLPRTAGGGESWNR